MINPDKSPIKENRIYIFFLLIISSIILFTVIRLCLCGLASFDGAMNLQVPYQLMNEGIYSTTYNGGTLFDERIQTGIPVLLPIYFIFLIFGVGPIQTTIINGIYLLGMYILIYIIGMEVKIDKWLLLALEIIICITPNLSDYGMGVYGEIPTLFWLLMTTYTLQQTEKHIQSKYFIWSGIFYGLAFLTKTVILIAMPSLMLVLISKCFIEKRIKFQQFLLWILGFLIPVLLFELYKIIQLGLTQYVDKQKILFPAVAQQAGVSSGFSDTSGILNKLLLHIQTFGLQYQINIVILILILSINFLYFAVKILRQRKLDYFDIIILVAFSYFGWWLLITPTEKAWARRIIIGVILMELVTCFVWNTFYRKYKNKYLNFLLFFTLVVSALSASYKAVQINDSDKQNILEASEFLKNYVEENPDTIVCGCDWWQAPVVSIMSGIPFYDINKMENNFENIIFVEDQYAFHLIDLTKIKELYGYDVIYSNDTPIFIYKINCKYPYKPFNENEKQQVSRAIYEYTEEYEYIRGTYAYESGNNLRWASKNVGLLLKNSSKPQYLNFKFKIRDYEKIPENNCILQIFINESSLCEQRITGNGEYELNIDINGMLKENQTAEIYIKTNFAIDTSRDARELSYNIISLKLSD